MLLRYFTNHNFDMNLLTNVDINIPFLQRSTLSCIVQNRLQILTTVPREQARSAKKKGKANTCLNLIWCLRYMQSSIPHICLSIYPNCGEAHSRFAVREGTVPKRQRRRKWSLIKLIYESKKNKQSLCIIDIQI